jgi:Tfp pilus assembly protein PilF
LPCITLGMFMDRQETSALGFKEVHIFSNLGMAIGELNRIEKSMRAFRKALDIDPDSFDNHFGLAHAYQRGPADELAEGGSWRRSRLTQHTSCPIVHEYPLCGYG